MPTLNWIGKDAVIRHHKDVPFHLVRDVADLSCGDPGSGNLILRADNLVGLKALLPYYAGQIKCIAIDPPYNTGNEEWVYNDNVNSPAMKKWLGQVVRKEGETLDRHDRWLCMMYPRLRILRDFLTQDGVILICIDDVEVHLLKCLLNEIFGSSNFLGQLVWEKGRKNDARFFSIGHEYVLVYARSASYLRELDVRWRQGKAGADEIHAEYLRLMAAHKGDLSLVEKALKEFYKALPKDHPSKKHSRYNKVDSTGVWRDDNMSWPGGGGPTYEVIHPVTGKSCRVPDGGWRYATHAKMQEMIQSGKVVFRETHEEPPIRKTYLVRDAAFDEQGEDIGEEVMGSYFYRSAIQATNVVSNIFGRPVFPNPKDHEIIGRLVRYVTNADKNCIVMDSFGGSGTTAHAVLEQNKLDDGMRRFVLVEMDENIAKNITADRIRRVAKGFKNAKGEDVPGLGGGFRFCELGSQLFDAGGQINESVKFADLARHIYFVATGEPLPKARVLNTPFLGIHNGRAICLLYNGILKDKSPKGGNALTHETLGLIKEACAGVNYSEIVIFGTSQRLAPARLKRENVTFRQIPYSLHIP